MAKLEGRQAAVEADGVVPQSTYATASNDGKPYVVPNPYRGRAHWDLTPNATDPTGTHVDFFNLPTDWTRVRIYTVSGDLVQEITRATCRPTAGRSARWPATGRRRGTWCRATGRTSSAGSTSSAWTPRAQGTKRGKFTVIR